MAPAIATKNLRKVFSPDIVALDDFTLDIAPGSVVAVLGPNGAGKTTLIEMLLGLQTPTSGSIEVLGGAPTSRRIKAQVGAMLQDTDAPASLTAREIVDLTGQYYPRALPTDGVLEIAGLAEHRTKRAAQLSGGQRQRLSFAMAIVGDPKVVYLDEPTAALDVVARRRFWQQLQVFTDRGATVLFSSHNLAEVEEVADRVIMLARGRIVADAAPRELSALAARMLISFTTTTPPAAYAPLAGVARAEAANGGVTLAATDSDAALRALVASNLPFANLTVSRARLEDAFLQFTAPEEQVRS